MILAPGLNGYYPGSLVVEDQIVLQESGEFPAF
jgi:hypothetical protein